MPTAVEQARERMDTAADGAPVQRAGVGVGRAGWWQQVEPVAVSISEVHHEMMTWVRH